MENLSLSPRQEVLQQLLPPLATAGRTLTPSTVIATIRQLAKVQTPEFKISFDRWLVVAKDNLKWNDYCIQLFWEILQSCIRCCRGESTIDGMENTLVDIEFVALFLALHVQDKEGTASRLPSPTATFESIWPHADPDITSSISPLSGAANPLSPTKSPTSSPKKHFSFPTGPVSSPKQSPKNSPRRAYPLSPREQSPRSTSQLSSSLRAKLPLLLRALVCSTEATDVDMGSSTAFSAEIMSFELGSGGISGSSILDARLSHRAVDCLDLVLKCSYTYTAGGNSRQGQQRLSSFVASRCNDILEMHSSSSTSSIQIIPVEDSIIPPTGLTPLTLESRASSSASVLSMTDVLSESPGAAALHTSQVLECLDAALVSSSSYSRSNHQFNFEEPLLSTDRRFSSIDKPQRVVDPMSSFLSIRSITLSDVSTTFFLLASTGPAGKSQRRAQQQTSGDKDSGAMSTSAGSGSEGAMSEATHDGDGEDSMSCFDETRASSIEGNGIDIAGWIPGSISDLGSVPNSLLLPQATIEDSTGATVYLLAPFSSVLISNCINCDVVLGAVAHVVHLLGCENVRLTSASCKVLLRNCRDCIIYSSSLAHSVTNGDCRGLVFAPHNTNYRSLSRHLQMAGLLRLTQPSISGSISVGGENWDMNYDDGDSAEGSADNTLTLGSLFWSYICDVATCVDSPLTASSPTGYAIDAAGPGRGDMSSAQYRTFPKPPESIASLLSPDRFSTVSIPYRSEQLDIHASPIKLPVQFRASLAEKQNRFVDLKRKILNADGTEGNMSASNQSQLGTVITSSFLDWLTTTGKSQHVIDLINLDKRS